MIEPWLFAALTGVAVVTGFIDSIAGGGGLIMMPTLLFAGLPPHIALGTNKLQSICGTTMAAWRYRKAGLFRVGPNRVLVGVVFAGALAGALTIQRIDGRSLALLVPVLLLAVALYTVFSPRMDDHDSEPRIDERRYLPLAGGIGFYDGFFGPGTGSFFAVSLVGLRGMGLTRATGLTKLLNLTSNLASLIVFALGGQVLWLLGLCMALGAIAGAWLGAHSATRFGARLIRPLLVTASLALTGKLIWGWFA
ncbi:TSUP family transporter [Novosphingobium flavum]|uniref:Probable membrane transporter protein n=1 Tax=Novosphingobium aerophilum TaxID=2839843 RepID=A0A7X1KAV4_9SPHN|nr:TSUP family transporter [Novosphingobium aerophilum]MBC2650554.1 TSUP family transporter [Novosphingobium aerophilum]MBC2660538.1 TSUP family transporter [Novosphingobium aerophilum]